MASLDRVKVLVLGDSGKLLTIFLNSDFYMYLYAYL